MFVIANVCFEASNVLYNAFLPEVASSDQIGRVSGFGWGLGYVGGLLCLGVALWLMKVLPTADDVNVRASNLLVAGWYLLFSLPLFLFLRERRPRGDAGTMVYVRQGFGRLRTTFREFKRYREAAKFMVARLIYNDGLVTVFAMASIYAGIRFGMTESDVGKDGDQPQSGSRDQCFRVWFHQRSNRRQDHHHHHSRRVDRRHPARRDGQFGSRLLDRCSADQCDGRPQPVGVA